MALSVKAKLRKEKKQKEKNKSEGEIVVITDDQKVTNAQPVNTRKAKVKKASLRNPDIPKAKFKKRQIHKTWLPTHIFHAKRAHMTPPKEPLWKFAIPISPTNKVYRSTHRASSIRGAVAWDTSYISTIGLEGPEKSIEGILKALGVGVAADKDVMWKSQSSKWMKGLRSLETILYEREGWPIRCIGPASIIWNTPSTDAGGESTDLSHATSKAKPKRKVFMRISPAGFLQLWEEVIRLARVQKPSVTVEDLRFEIGSIEITGPNATEVLVGTLWPTKHQTSGDPSANTVGNLWRTLASIANPSTLPASAIVAFECSDPRLHHPPRTVKIQNDAVSFQKCLEVVAKWPLDDSSSPASIFDRNVRLKASRSLPSQKSINRRKGAAAPGEYPDSMPMDPSIPLLMFNTRSQGSNQGSWTVLLPWKCVLPVWSCLMYYPLSCGGNPRFAGLLERRQISFESGAPWFPGDYPGTKAGNEWEQREAGERKTQWEKKPKGRRIEYEKLDLGQNRKGEVGRGWMCDWERLGELIERPASAASPQSTVEEESSKPNSEMQSLGQTQKAPGFYHLPRSFAQPAMTDESYLELHSQPLVTVRLRMITQGVPKTCARIYRLPTADPLLRQEWVSLRSTTQSKPHRKAPAYKKPGSAASNAEYRSYLAAKIEDPEVDSLKPGSANYPIVPDAVDLIGFVTSGNFNLAEGLGTGIGSIALSRVLERVHGADRSEQQLCIVRDAGQDIGRLARWELA